MGDLGGYGIADQPPAGPHFRPRALRVCNSISAHVTHAEIAFIYSARLHFSGNNNS